MATVHDIRVRVQELLPRHQPLRGFLGIVKHTLERFHERGSWSFDFGSATFDTVASYDTGTIAVTNGSATVTGTGTTFTAGMVGRKIRIGGVIYEVGTFTSTTSIDLTETYPGTTDSGLSYVIYQDIYSLASDVVGIERIWDQTNERTLCAASPIDLKTKDTELNVSGTWVRQYSKEGRDSSDNWQIRLWPYPTDVARIQYWYDKRHTMPTGPNSTIDLPSYMDETLIQGVYARALQVLRDPSWRDERAEFEVMLMTKWAEDHPMRDLVIRARRNDVSPAAFYGGTNPRQRIQSL